MKDIVKDLNLDVNDADLEGLLNPGGKNDVKKGEESKKKEEEDKK